ncbi:unnamed protein product, partial [Adineta ricciae]
LYPLLAISSGQYNNVSLIMGNNDYEQPICFEHPLMTSSEALTEIAATFPPERSPMIADYYHLHNCSMRPTVNATRCYDIVRRILMDSMFDCDIRRLFNAFYAKYGAQYEQNKLFSYHLNCYPLCPIVQQEGICRYSSEILFVFGTVSDVDSQQQFHYINFRNLHSNVSERMSKLIEAWRPLLRMNLLSIAITLLNIVATTLPFSAVLCTSTGDHRITLNLYNTVTARSSYSKSDITTLIRNVLHCVGCANGENANVCVDEMTKAGLVIISFLAFITTLHERIDRPYVCALAGKSTIVEKKIYGMFFN